jgi:hypothetical protein
MELESGIQKIHNIKKEELILSVKEFTWQKYAEKFISHQYPINKKSWI